ncbi:hypothetical protein F5Y17DRAFT_414827 [Xylariaceae sp. FL0594]|nr:hypothetical protein F5Y17DRAFT_414827 [Xylariaceae sp. FL0594]
MKFSAPLLTASLCLSGAMADLPYRYPGEGGPRLPIIIERDQQPTGPHHPPHHTHTHSHGGFHWGTGLPHPPKHGNLPVSPGPEAPTTTLQTVTRGPSHSHHHHHPWGTGTGGIPIPTGHGHQHPPRDFPIHLHKPKPGKYNATITTRHFVPRETQTVPVSIPLETTTA